MRHDAKRFVRARRPLAERFADGLVGESERDPEACWPWLGDRTNDGYGLIRVSDHGERPKRRAVTHRVAWELVHGPIPDGLVVCHRCDNPPCVNVRHLFLGSVADNNADMQAKGRQARGESLAVIRRAHALRGADGPAAKLRPADVRRIRAAYARGGRFWGATELAAEFGVSKSTVLNVAKGKTWSDFGLVIAEHRDCGSTLAVPADPAVCR